MRRDLGVRMLLGHVSLAPEYSFARPGKGAPSPTKASTVLRREIPLPNPSPVATGEGRDAPSLVFGHPVVRHEHQ